MRALRDLIKKAWLLVGNLYGDYRKTMLVLSALGLVVGFLESFGITLLIPLFTFFTGGTGLGGSFSVELVQRFFEITNIRIGFQALLAVTIFVFLLKTAVLFGFGYYRTRMLTNYKNDTRRAIYEGFLLADYSFLRSQKIGYVDGVILRDTKQSTQFLEKMVAVLLAVSNTFIYATVSFFISPYITIAALLFGVGILVLYKPIIRLVRQYSRKAVAMSKEISHGIGESLLGMKTIKAAGVEQGLVREMGARFLEIEEAEFKKQIAKHFAKVSLEPLSIMFIVVVFAITYKYFQFDIISFASVMYLVNRIFSNIENIQSSLHVASETIPAAQEVQNLLNLVKSHPERTSGDQPFSFEREIAFEKVSFSYDKTLPILEDFSLKVGRGEAIGVMGSSGAGKTTFADILLRLIYPKGGVVTMDGTPIEDILIADWRKHVVYVSQEPFLMNDTIEQNIRFYDQTITHEDVIEAAKRAHIYDMIKELPKQLATHVGERGTRLSGGERQRIVLARALARKPAVLILDEATSALDGTSEAAIKETLVALKGSITLIVIAHKPSTIEYVDRVIVFEGGRVVEQGSPLELSGREGSYYRQMMQHGEMKSVSRALDETAL
ncbi:MAG: ABC transporter ATP-binding protein [Patescibacteria group bacterium]